MPNIQALRQQQVMTNSSVVHTQAQAHAAQAQHLAAQQAAASQTAAVFAAAPHTGFLNAQKRASPQALQQMAAARGAAGGDLPAVNGAGASSQGAGLGGVHGAFGAVVNGANGNGMMRPSKRHKISSARGTPGPGSPMNGGMGAQVMPSANSAPGGTVNAADIADFMNMVNSGDRQSVPAMIVNQIRNSGVIPRGVANADLNGGEKIMKNKNVMRQQPKKSTQEPEDEDDEENNDSALYCFCQQVSYGDMVACDNEDCRYEWFHYGCVGLKSPPSGVWYCSQECQEKTQKTKMGRK